MKWANHLAEWLFRFASSQRNIDRVAMWLGGTVALVDAALAIVILAMLKIRQAVSAGPTTPRLTARTVRISRWSG